MSDSTNNNNNNNHSNNNNNNNSNISNKLHRIILKFIQNLYMLKTLVYAFNKTQLKQIIITIKEGPNWPKGLEA